MAVTYQAVNPRPGVGPAGSGHSVTWTRSTVGGVPATIDLLGGSIACIGAPPPTASLLTILAIVVDSSVLLDRRSHAGSMHAKGIWQPLSQDARRGFQHGRNSAGPGSALPILPSNLWEVQFCKAATIVLQSRADHWLRKAVCFSGCMSHKYPVTHHLSAETSQRKGGAMAPVVGIDVGGTFTDVFAKYGRTRAT